MDPASVVGLLASIESLADGAFKLVSLINTIKQGGKQRLRLFTELNSLWMVLKLLEGHFDPEEQHLNEHWLGAIKLLDEDDGIFDQISTVFEGLTDRLQPKMGHRKVMQTLRWPYDKSEVEDLTAHLERLKNTLSLAYNSTNAAAVREIQSDTKYIKQSVTNDEVKAIMDWISNLNFLKQQVQDTNRALLRRVLIAYGRQASSARLERAQGNGSLIVPNSKHGPPPVRQCSGALALWEPEKPSSPLSQWSTSRTPGETRTSLS